MLSFCCYFKVPSPPTKPVDYAFSSKLMFDLCYSQGEHWALLLDSSSGYCKSFTEEGSNADASYCQTNNCTRSDILL